MIFHPRAFGGGFIPTPSKINTVEPIETGATPQAQEPEDTHQPQPEQAPVDSHKLKDDVELTTKDTSSLSDQTSQSLQKDLDQFIDIILDTTSKSSSVINQEVSTDDNQNSTSSNKDGTNIEPMLGNGMKIGKGRGKNSWDAPRRRHRERPIFNSIDLFPLQIREQTLILCSSSSSSCRKPL